MSTFQRSLDLPMPNFERQHANRVFELHDREHGQAIVPLADVERKVTFKWTNLTKHAKMTLVLDGIQKELLVQDNVAWKVTNVTPPNGTAIVLFKGVAVDSSTLKAYVGLDYQEGDIMTNLSAPVWSENLSVLPTVSEFELMETKDGHVKIQESQIKVGRFDWQRHFKGQNNGETSVVSHIFS